MGNLDDNEGNSIQEDARCVIQNMAVDELSSPVKKRRAKLLSVFDTEYIKKKSSNNEVVSMAGKYGGLVNDSSAITIAEQRWQTKE